MPLIVRESQLDAWVRANPRDSEGVIPELIGRLVAESAPKALLRRFPGADSVGQPGVDGRLQTAEVEPSAVAFVPVGDSHWEIGTGGDPRAKATEDYRIRTAGTPEEERRGSTFVFVTPLSARRAFSFSWRADGQLEWIRERKAANDWKDIRIIDGASLTEWLRAFPAINRGLGGKIGGLAQIGVEGLDERWSTLRSIATPALSPDVFLVGRDAVRERVNKVLTGENNFLRVNVQAASDLADFASAYIASLAPAEQQAAVDSCLVVSTRETWTFLVEHGEPQVLIVGDGLDLSDERGGLAIQSAKLKGHRILMPSLDLSHDPESVTLHSPGRTRLEKALEEAGQTRDRSRTLALRSAGNLTTLKRMLLGNLGGPRWAKAPLSSELILALELGGWSEEHPADVELIEKLSGQKYDTWIKALHPLLALAESPLKYREKVWQFKARFEGWYALGPGLLDQTIEDAGAAAIAVLGERDPQFDLAKDDRYMAQIRGKEPKHSRLLRSGLAEFLALLGSHPNALINCSRLRAQGVAWKAVHELLQEPDYLRWASLDGELPLLAEGSPDAFLAAIEAALAAEPNPFVAVFNEEGDGIFGRTHMCGLLWGLESIAWEADQLSRVILVLGALAAIDPGGKWSNRPDSTLVTILLPWLPQTGADESRRVRALQSLVDEHPDVGWTVLLRLLPEMHGISMPIYRPRWKDLDLPPWTEGVSRGEYLSQVRRYSELAVVAAAGSTSRRIEIIKRFAQLHPDAQSKLVAHLEKDSIGGVAEGDRYLIWKALNDLVRKHRRFADAAWTLPQQEVEKLARVAEAFAPVSSVLRALPSFRQRWHEVVENQGSWREQEERLLRHRQATLRSVLDSSSFAGLLDLARQAEDVASVGWALGESSDLASEVESHLLPALIDSQDECLAKLASAFSRARFWRDASAWPESLELSTWTNEQIAALFAALPGERDVWRRAEAVLGDARNLYWTRASVIPRGADSGASEALGRLLEVQRPRAALFAIYYMTADKENVAPDTVVQALLAAVKSTEPAPALDGFQACEIIGALQQNPATRVEDLVRVEWAYLGVLDRHSQGRPRTLERALSTDSQFFSEVVAIAYKPRHEESRELDEGGRARAANAWKLLHDWRTPPGLQPDGSFDGDALRGWLALVEETCRASDRFEVAMQTTGQVLIHVPADPDGLWIHRAAAGVLNDKNGDDVRKGFRIATLNSRGAVWRDTSGNAEKELASEQRTRALEVEAAGFPRFATTVRDIATSYEREAEFTRNDDARDE